MDINHYIKQKKELCEVIYRFIDEKIDFEDLKTYILSTKVVTNVAELKSFFRFLGIIANNHKRNHFFLSKIKEIIVFFKDKIKQMINIYDILDVFKQNKNIILYLLESEIITAEDFTNVIDDSISIEYKCFFYPEIKDYVNSSDKIAIEQKLSELDSDTLNNFKNIRQFGENHHYICSLIRSDLISDFVFYLTLNDISPTEISIKPSIFETNSFLIENKNITPIEYASFFGSKKIFQYLKKKGIPIKRSLLKYAIHSGDCRLIRMIEDDLTDVQEYEKNNETFFVESVKCHHNEIADYMSYKIDENKRLCLSFEFHNFYSFSAEEISNIKNEELFYISCKYDYVDLLEILQDKKVFVKEQEAFEKGIGNSDVLQFLLDNKIIGINKFSKCEKLRRITIPSFVTSIDEYSFYKCKSLKQITIPPSVTRIKANAFDNCSSLQKITIPSSITNIESYTFRRCSSLKEIEIPSSVTTIEECAFQDCSSLQKITIPSDVSIIHINTFNGCSSLKEIEIPSSVTTIEECAFQDCSSLQKITIPSDVSIIHINTFNGCSSLKEITIPSSVTKIEESAFEGCSLLREIVIPSSVTSIEINVFKKCSSLVAITIPCSITTIKEGAFNGCFSLKEITIPSSVTKIKSSAFTNCSSLEEVTIPSSVKKIKYSLFSGCSSLKQITLPESITTIESFAFAGCSSLEKISLPSSISNIDSYAFYWCSSLTEIEIPPEITSIESGTFGGCSSLKKVIFHDSFESIEEYAFFGCFSLDPSSIPSTINVHKNAFDVCFELKKHLQDRCHIQLRNKIFNYDDYKIGQNIGQNYNYPIYKAKEIDTGKEFVFKSSRNVISIFIDYALSNIGIPGILKINWYSDQYLANMDSFENEDRQFPLIISTDYMKNGSLDKVTNDYLRSHGNRTPNMNPTVRSKIIFGIACIMKKVHKLGIIHQNLTMDNILLDDNFEPLINCIGTFVYHANFVDEYHEHKLNIFTSPEVIINDEITIQSDVYSYAIILYLMFSRNPIFKSQKRINKNWLFHFIKNGGRFERPQAIPDDYWDLIERCWHQFPEERPTFEEITDILKNDIYALEEFGMKTDLQELHEYQNRMDKE